MNLQSINDIERNIDLLTSQLSQLKQRESELMTQLAGVSPETQGDRPAAPGRAECPTGQPEEQVFGKIPGRDQDQGRDQPRWKSASAKTPLPACRNVRTTRPTSTCRRNSSTRSEIQSVNSQIGDLKSGRDGYKRWPSPGWSRSIRPCSWSATTPRPSTTT